MIRRASEALRATPDAWRMWWQVVLLGVLMVGAYGLVLYSFGVLIGPVHDETGWSIGWLSFAFTLSFLIVGLGAAVAGWLLDRVGGRPVMLSSLAIGSVLLMVNASAESLPVFIITWGVGGGILGAGLFYNVTMALTTRLFPENRVRAFAVLTFVGGFASVIYFPLSGFLVDLLDWRDALRIMVGLLALTVLPAALLIPGGAASKVAATAPATTIAAVRGFLSLPGWALMEPVIQRTGVRGATMTAYAMMVVGTVVLLGGGGWPGSCCSQSSPGWRLGRLRRCTGSMRQRFSASVELER